MTAINNQELLFWQKPGCEGNRRQLKLLHQQGFKPRVLSLFEQHWTASELKSFFSGKPLTDWFNTSAPAIKCGTINLETLDEDMALLMMVNDPILIRRPLMQYGSLKQAGFVAGAVIDELQITLNPQQQLDRCPQPDGLNHCDH
ncbi:MAG: nitrogenase-associated protein [gamma proteobacterium symbiont of Phacoides pectinatus]